MDSCIQPEWLPRLTRGHVLAKQGVQAQRPLPAQTLSRSLLAEEMLGRRERCLSVRPECLDRSRQRVSGEVAGALGRAAVLIARATGRARPRARVDAFYRGIALLTSGWATLS